MNSDDRIRSVGEYAGLIRRRWPILAGGVAAALLAGVTVAYLLPPEYRSTGTIMSEGASISPDVVESSIRQRKDDTLDAFQRLELVRRKVMSPANLQELVKRADPYPARDDLDAGAKASMLADNTSVQPVNPVTFEPLETSVAFSIHYENPDPRIASVVARELTDLFVNFNTQVRTEQAAEATSFLQREADQLEASMQGMEKKLAAFKARYGDALPTSQARNLMGVDRARRDLEDVERRVLVAEERESLLQVQIGELSPTLASAVGNWRTELAKLKGELALAEQKYTPEHPDVRRLRRAISELTGKGNSSDSSYSGQADNPEYLRISSQLFGARRELASLRATASRLRSELSGYESNIATAPTVESEYVQLVRQYENAQARYEDLQGKIKDASLAQELEAEAKGERYVMIREPSVASKPFAPNRLGIILIALVLGGGVSLLLAVLRESADPTVRSARDLEGIFDADPLAAIPLIETEGDVVRRRRQAGAVVAAYGVAAAACGAAILVIRN